MGEDIKIELTVIERNRILEFFGSLRGEEILKRIEKGNK